MHFLDLPPWLLSLLLAPFGLVLGSFGNVLIHRLPLEDPADRNVATKPSHCPRCKARIRWYHNVPLLSWLVLRGKCADCGAPISFRYPLVELLGGLILAGSVWVFPFGTLIWFKGVICALALLVLFFTDFTEFMLPDVLQFPLMALGLLFTVPQIFWPEHLTTVVGHGWNLLRVETFLNGLQAAPAWIPAGHLPVTWKESLIGLVAGYGLPWLVNLLYKLIRKTDGLGMGDFKMLAWLGAFWGWGAMLGILFAASLLAVVFALPLLISGRAKGQTMLPLGCFLALGTLPVVFYGPALWAGYQALFR
ncbi:MAG: prepilin peptidase [Firmicutes bacterium]|nr:prepilin peptidase [Bacillota bacterium]